MSVQHLKRRVAANIKRLKEVRGVRRHAESNNLVILAKLIKLWRCVAAVAVKNEQSIRALRTRLRMSVKVLYLLKAKLISRLSIVAKSDCPV
jgi:hypothetical protein